MEVVVVGPGLMAWEEPVCTRVQQERGSKASLEEAPGCREVVQVLKKLASVEERGCRVVGAQESWLA